MSAQTVKPLQRTQTHTHTLLFSFSGNNFRTVTRAFLVARTVIMVSQSILERICITMAHRTPVIIQCPRFIDFARIIAEEKVAALGVLQNFSYKFQLFYIL